MNDARSVAVIAEVNKLIPNKPIRYMMNTHPHVDHTGGVRGYAAIGATIITQQANVPFIEALLRTPHTIIPDSLSKAPNAKFHVEGVEESRTITDGTRKLEIYHMRGSNHSSGMLMTYLPAEKILTEGDPWTPGMVKVKPTDRPSQRCCDAQNLYENIKRLNLDVKTFAPIHGRTATWDEFVEVRGLQTGSCRGRNGEGNSRSRLVAPPARHRPSRAKRPRWTCATRRRYFSVRTGRKKPGLSPTKIISSRRPDVYQFESRTENVRRYRPI